MKVSRIRSRLQTTVAVAAVGVLIAAMPGAVLAAIVDSYSTGFEDFTLGAMSDGTTTQNGWSGGAQPGFTNATAGDEAITTAAAHTGTQSWRLTHGYNSPGQGTPFTPNLSAGLGDPGIAEFNGSLWFRAVGAADNSSIAINTGTFAGTDRAEIVAYLVNELSGIRLYTFGDGFAPIDIAVGLAATVWHELSFSLTKSGALNSLTVSVDGAAPVTVNPAGLSDFRADNSFPYADSSRLKFNARGISSGPPATPDPNALGYYIDDITYSVSNANGAVPEATSLIVWSLLALTISVKAARRRTRIAG